jgi:hypothetical protein
MLVSVRITRMHVNLAARHDAPAFGVSN